MVNGYAQTSEKIALSKLLGRVLALRFKHSRHEGSVLADAEFGTKVPMNSGA